jgi:ABC-type Fe3+ transport system substrate-binding protein
MSLFADVDWDQGSDNPFGLDPGTYEVTISDAEVERSEKGNLGLWLTFSAENGKSIRKWITMPEKNQDADTYSRNTSFLRLTLKQLEIPEGSWDDLAPEDFIGLDCVIIVSPQKKNPEYNQISKLSRAKGTPTQGTSSTGDGFGAFTKPEVPSDGGFKF